MNTAETNDQDINNNDDDDCLDTSWIQQENRIQNIQQNYSREPMDVIHGVFIYINQNNYIDKIIREIIHLQVNSTDNSSYISPDSLLKIIQNKKLRTPNSKYKFSNLFTNIINIDPEQIQSFSKIQDNQLINTSFFNEVPITDSIIIPSSIFIFHPINTIYFFFQEIPTHRHNLTLKSALKTITAPDQTTPDTTISHRNTKKVRICDKHDKQKLYKKHATKKGTRKRRT